MGQHGITTYSKTGVLTIFVVLLFSIYGHSSEIKCVIAEINGSEASFVEAVRKQLRNEFSELYFDHDSNPTCQKLFIEIQKSIVRIMLTEEGNVAMTLDLNEVAPNLRARAVALSSAGLLNLSEISEDIYSADSLTTRTETSNTSSSPSEQENYKSENNEFDSSSHTKFEKYTGTNIRFQVALGTLYVPKFRTTVLQALPGIGISWNAVQLHFSLLGEWSRKTLDIGEIFTAGVGLRLTLWLKVFEKGKILLRLAPSIDLAGIFAYGNGKEGVSDESSFSPVLNVLGLIGLRAALKPKISICLEAGGGFSMLGFRLQADNRNVTGQDGGLIAFSLGIEFGH